MEDNSKQKQAWVTAMRLLAASPKTRKEMAQKLAEKGYPQEVILLTLAQLEKQQVIDDRAYASNLINRYRSVQPSGVKRIAFEMKRHGISSKIQEELLEDWSEDAEFERAKDIAGRRWERLSHLTPEKRSKRVYDLLARRGFDFQICRDIIRELNKDADD
ncbi:MAG TPA: regulatory protein RecX [bacterium]|nr:regulatory protein RecX [bacterium]